MDIYLCGLYFSPGSSLGSSKSGSKDSDESSIPISQGPLVDITNLAVATSFVVTSTIFGSLIFELTVPSFEAFGTSNAMVTSVAVTSSKSSYRIQYNLEDLDYRLSQIRLEAAYLSPIVEES